MKNLLLLIAFALMSFTGYSQDSTLTADKVLIQGKDTLFAWKLVKCRSMAKSLVRLTYCDSISSLQQDQISTLDSANAVQAKFIEVLHEQKKNQQAMMELKQKEADNLNADIVKKDREIRKQKALKIAGFSLAGLVTLLGLVY